MLLCNSDEEVALLIVELSRFIKEKFEYEF